MTTSQRLSGSGSHFFANLTHRLNALIQSGVDVIRLDVGSPDMAPASFIVDRLIQEVQKSGAHGYMPYGGPSEFRKAVQAYYLQRFGVSLDPNKEVEGLMGSKEGVFKLTQAIINPGDVVIVPSPGYTTYQISAQIAEAEVYSVPLLRDNHFLPDYSKIPGSVLRRTRLLWLNYPNNPTGAIAPNWFFEQSVELAAKYNILIAHDSPYMEICFDGYRASSILQISGAKEVCVELNSLSKTYNMAGWRLGMACGKSEAISALHLYKAQSDSSHFGPIYQAGAAALTGDQSWLVERNATYAKRRNVVLAGLSKIGIEAIEPKAALYVWAKAPNGLDDVDFCNLLFDGCGVSLTPGSIYGEFGKGYFRVSLCTSEERIEQAMRRIEMWLEKNVDL